MRSSEEILKQLKEESGKLEIPESVTPKQVQRRLEQYRTEETAGRKIGKFYSYRKILGAAACFCMVVGAVAAAFYFQGGRGSADRKESGGEKIPGASVELAETDPVGIPYPEVTYEEIYASMEQRWEEERKFYTSWRDTDVANGGALKESMAYKGMESASDESVDAGATNIQTAGVDEGDIVKNDGRYLYQRIRKDTEENGQAIQIIDTENGLAETARIEGFDNIEEFYVWEGILVVIESKYLDHSVSAKEGEAIWCDVVSFADAYHEISFYDLTDRRKPEKVKTFTLQGMYASSRVSDGYFYGFSRFYASQGTGETDYTSYIPVIDGVCLKADRIYLPAESKGTSYLVLVSVDLRDPVRFTDTTAIVSGGDTYYVSRDQVYVAETKDAGTEEGWNSDQTSLLRFSYGKGKFLLKARGEIKGRLDSSFSMDEYENYLRAVTTVSEYKREIVTDDRTGENIGSHILEERQTNALYVLDESLQVMGKIEGLAEDEQIYSARFLGETGYFVTFRQTDPLFAVDLSDPKNPRILSELKVSGFSEYLHAYGNGQLFGLGMEADEETGQQEGMKLSMFDISDPSNVQEISRLPLEEYGYSDGLYNHHAVMISPEKNVIGFQAVGREGNGFRRDYLVFTYENGKFVQKLRAGSQKEEESYITSRGTFLGDIFYVLSDNGRAESYDLNTGKQLGVLNP